MQDEINIYPIFIEARNFIDLMLQRGAVRGEEINALANLRTQIVSVINIIETQNSHEISPDNSETS